MKIIENMSQREIINTIAEQLGCTVDEDYSDDIYPYDTYSDWARSYIVDSLLKEKKVRRFSILVINECIIKLKITFIDYPNILYYMKCLIGLEELSDLVQIPDEIGKLQNLRQLDICTLGITFNEKIWNLTFLEKLNICCLSESVINGNIDKLIKLKELTIVNLKLLPAKITQLRQLRKLDISGTNETGLTSHLSKCCKNLVDLNISNMPIIHLPDFIYTITSLEKLNISETFIYNLDGTIGNLINLKELNLFGTLITELPEEIESCQELKKITFPETLTRLPQHFSNLKKIEELDLKNTNIEFLPKTLGEMINVNRITFPRTLVDLPNSIGRLQKIEILNFQYTKLVRIPESIGRLVNVKKIFLPSTLEYLPESFGNLKLIRHLFLKNTKIRTLPESIGSIVGLKEINVPYSLESLPESIGELILLRELDLEQTRIKKLPNSIGKLRNLTRITFPTEIEKLPDSIGNLVKISMLNLSRTHIKTLPESIGNMAEVEVITFPFGLLALPKSIGKLSKIKSLDLSYTNIEEIPDSIVELRNLKEIYFSKRLKKLPDMFGKLHLSRLNLEDTRITKLPQNIGDMTCLKEIKLPKSIEQLPQGFGKLILLENLDLSKTKIEKLPDDFDRLVGLKTLDLQNSCLKQLPSSLEGLHCLEELNLAYCKITSLPEDLGKLTNLKTLILDNTLIEELPDSIGKLNNLKKLSVCFTRLKQFPNSLCDLNNLEELEARGSLIDELPIDISKMTNLIRLNLESTKITIIPDGISQLSKLNKVCLNHLKLDYISKGLAELIINSLGYNDTSGAFFESDCVSMYCTQIINQEDTLFYCPLDVIESFYKDELVRLNECKVIFLGDGNVGKSSLIDRIVDDEFYEEKKATDGISIRNWRAKICESDVQIRFWDFGGQEIMHTMHLCFLTNRTIYVIVLDSRQDQYLEMIANDWMQTVNTFAPKCPIILVLNKCDTNPMVLMNLNNLKTRFPQLVGYVITSAKENTNIDKLKEIILYTIKEHSSYTFVFNKKWVGLKSHLEEMTLPYISNKEYIKLCNNYDILEPKLQRSLLNWFNDLGVSYHYSDDDDKWESDEINILNPEWVTNGIYRLILRTKTENGFVYHNDIYNVLARTHSNDINPNIIYTKKEVDFIMSIMRKRGMSINFGNKELIPLKLDASVPDNIDIDKMSCDILHFAIKGDYLPSSIIHRLIIGRINEVDFSQMWRNGVVLKNKFYTQALIEISYEMKYRLDIYVKSQRKGVFDKEYLNVIRDNINMNIAAMNLKNCEEFICYKLRDKRSGEEPYMRVYKPYMEGINKIYLPDVDGFINPSVLLNGIYTKQQINDMGEKYVMSNVINNYGSIDGSSFGIGNDNSYDVDFVSDARIEWNMKKLNQIEKISDADYEYIIHLMQTMLNDKRLNPYKRIELETILNDSSNKNDKWKNIRNFLMDAANLGTIISVFPHIINEIWNMFKII